MELNKVYNEDCLETMAKLTYTTCCTFVKKGGLKKIKL